MISTDSEGRTVLHAYDARGRLASKTYNGGVRTVSYTYDALDRLVELDDSAFGTPTTMAYDHDGRLATETTPQGTLHHEYDDLGRRTATATDDTRTQYTYDTLNRLSTVKQTERFNATVTDPQVTTYRYDKLGRLKSEATTRTASNTANNAREMTYDTLSRVTQIDHFRDPDADGHLDAGEQPIARFEYAHDQAGNRVQSDEWFDHDANNTLDVDEKQTFTYSYDALNRLRTETFAGPSDTNAPAHGDDYVHRYTFDANTNRQRWQKDHGGANPFTTTFDDTVNYDYDANDRIESETTTGTNPKTVTYEFGPNATTGHVGDHTNQTKKTEVAGGNTTTTTYTYNEMGRLASVSINDGSTTTTETYTYNHAGLRVTTTANGTTTTYLFDTTNPTGYAQVLEETVGSTLTKTYTLGLDAIAQATTAQLLTLLYDTHGSTRALLNTAASVLVHNGTPQLFSYDAYGNSLGFDPSASLTTLLYSGEWTSSDMTQWLRGRDRYEPSLGHFIQMDPHPSNFSNPLSIHRYGYVHSSPIEYRDPSGYYAAINDLLGTLKIGIGLSLAFAKSAIIAYVNFKIELQKIRAIVPLAYEIDYLANTLSHYSVPKANALRGIAQTLRTSLTQGAATAANTVAFSAIPGWGILFSTIFTTSKLIGVANLVNSTFGALSTAASFGHRSGWGVTSNIHTARPSARRLGNIFVNDPTHFARTVRGFHDVLLAYQRRDWSALSSGVRSFADSTAQYGDFAATLAFASPVQQLGNLQLPIAYKYDFSSQGGSVTGFSFTPIF